MGRSSEGCSSCQPCTSAAPHLVSVSVRAVLKQPQKNSTQVTNSTLHLLLALGFLTQHPPWQRAGDEMTMNDNLQLIICFVLLFLSLLPYLWHEEGQGQACSEFRYCFTAWHFSLSAIKDWQFLNPFQNWMQSFYFLKSLLFQSLLTGQSSLFINSFLSCLEVQIGESKIPSSQ